MFKSEILNKETLRAFLKSSKVASDTPSVDYYEKTYKYLQRNHRDLDGMRDALIKMPIGEKLRDLFFFFSHQKRESVLLASEDVTYLFRLIELLELDYLMPFFEFSWEKENKDNLDLRETVKRFREVIEKHDLCKREKILPFYIPKVETGKKQKIYSKLLDEILPDLFKIRTLILTDDNIRGIITSEAKEAQDRRVVRHPRYFELWHTMVERPFFKETRTKKGALSVPKFLIPFTNFIDDSYLLNGPPRVPGDVNSAPEFNPDVHVTLTSILGRMGLHRSFSARESKEYSLNNFLFYSIYYAHLEYVVSKPPLNEVTLPEEAVKPVVNASPEPVRIFILARLASKYRLPTHCLFSMIETIEIAHERYYAPGASDKFKNIMQRALESARQGKKQGDFSLVLGRTYLYQTKKKYTQAVETLQERARLNPEFRETLGEDLELIAIKFKEMAMQKYIENLETIISNSQAAFDFYINGMLIQNFKNFYPAFPELYMEWLAAEFAALSGSINKRIVEQHKDTFAASGILPEFILSELGIENTVKLDSKSTEVVGMNNEVQEDRGDYLLDDDDELEISTNVDFDLDIKF